MFSSAVQGCILLVCWLGPPAMGHVSLQFPRARKYDLDFLDSFRTRGECGMNAGDDITQLVAGSQINVTWHLGYPHGGGYKIQLIREDGSVEGLVPAAGGGGQDDWMVKDKFVQSHLLTLPAQPCQSCTLRLLRQATEWGGAYQFRSCSDVQLVSAGQLFSPCGQHGTLANNGACQCDARFSGDRCQYESLCQDDGDCNGEKGQGSCQVINDSVFQEKICFCNQGFYGDNCEKENTFSGPSEREFDRTQFSRVELGEHQLFWRTQGSELELILEAATSSWLAVGWRPSDASKSCQSFPADAPAPLGKDFHAMDCTDVVAGMARGAMGSVADYYTRDRSTPRRDSLWGGEDNLLSGSVWEEDGKTWLRFKKSLAGGTADHAFKGKLHLIWATGQEDDFYKADQFKYHGRKNRGIALIEVGEPSDNLTQDPVMIGLILALILLALLILVQVVDNLDRRWGVCGSCNPGRRNKFSPNA